MYFDKEQNEVREVIHLQTYNGLNDADTLVLSSRQVNAVKMIIDSYVKENNELKKEIHRQVWEAKDSRHAIDTPTGFIAKYTLRDDYGDLDCEEVFQKEEDAINYVMEKRDKEGVTDISVLCRKVN